MNHSEISNKQSDNIAQVFHSLAEEVDDHIPKDEFAFQYLARIWKTDPILVTQAIEKIAHYVSDKPRVAQELALSIIEISDRKFDDLCFNISKKQSTHDMTRMIINSCLISRHYEKAINQIENTVRKACRSFLENKLESMALLELVYQACFLRCKSVHSDISSMISSLYAKKTNSPNIHISEKKAIEVIASGMAQGEIYLKDVIRDNKSQIYEKEAAVFSLGCENKASYYPYFNELFGELYQNTRNTTICNEIIGAIMYSSYENDVISFFVNRLAQLRTDKKMTGGFLNLRSRHKNCISERLLFGCAYLLRDDSRLINELKQWLENEQEDIQVFTVLALEKQGVKCPDHEKKLKSELKFQRHFRKNITGTDLIMLRKTNWEPLVREF
jgi:hypothetical protein